jgi:hypothetical protein
MRKWLVRAWVGTAVITALFAIMVSPAAANQSDLSTVRLATASFHDLDKAMKAGYAPLLACFDQAGVGGMGQHYVNLSLLNSSVDVAQPEALVYEVDGNRLQLVAVEYIIPQSAWTSSQPPSLLGRSFTRNDALGLWVLHAWIWKPNPDGIFANYNPSVRMCPGH